MRMQLPYDSSSPHSVMDTILEKAIVEPATIHDRTKEKGLARSVSVAHDPEWKDDCKEAGNVQHEHETFKHWHESNAMCVDKD